MHQTHTTDKLIDRITQPYNKYIKTKPSHSDNLISSQTSSSKEKKGRNDKFPTLQFLLLNCERKERLKIKKARERERQREKKINSIMIMKWAKEQVEDAGGAGLGVGAAPAAAPHSTDQNFILLCTHLAHSLSVFHCIFSYYLFIYLFPFSLPRTFVASAAWIEYATPISTIFLVFHFKWIASSILFPRHHFIFKNKARNRFFFPKLSLLVLRYTLRQNQLNR